MQVEYEKTIYEEVLEILDTAYRQNRKIKRITLIKSEWEEFLRLHYIPKFVKSLGSLTYITSMGECVGAREPRRASLHYHCLDKPIQQSAIARWVDVVIL